MSQPEPIRSKTGLAEFYDDPRVVGTYLGRKAQPLGSVLHDRQVAYLNRVIGELTPAKKPPPGASLVC